MTVPSQTSRDQQIGNGVTAIFTVPFRILDETHLRVLLTVDGVTAEQILTTNYSVSGVGGANTTVTFLVAPPLLSTITFLRSVPLTQETDYVPNDPFPAESHERALDKLTMMVQQVDEGLDRSLTLPEQVSGVSAELPAPVSLNLIGWNAGPTGLRNFTVAEIGTTLAFSNFIADKFIAVAAQTDFILTADPGSLANLDVSVDGVTQVPVDDYTLDGVTLTFSAPMAGGEVVLVRYGTALPTGITAASAVAFTQAGAGAIPGTVQGELRRTIHVEQFGALAEGDDWKSAIDYALALAASVGGADVLLSAKDYGTSGRISIPSGCGLIGEGAGQYPPAAFAASANFLATPKTRIVALAGFPAATPVVDMAVTRGDTYAVHGAGIRGVMIDCDAVAEIGMRWRGVKNSYADDVLIFRPATGANCIGWLIDCGQGKITTATAQAGAAATITLAAASSPRDDHYNGATISITGGTGAGQSKTITDYNGTTKVATVDSAWGTPPDATSVYTITGEATEGNGATQFNEIANVTVWLGASGSAAGIVWEGDGIHDVNQNNYRNVQVVHANGPGLRFYNGDTDFLYGVRTYAFGNGWGCELHGSETTNYEGYCRNQFFYGCLFGGANVGGRSNTAQGGAGLTITLDAGANATDDYYNNKFVTITGGTGVGQRRKISDYTGATKVALVSEAWTTAPDATSTFTVNGGGGVALFKGAYRTSRYHSFDGYESGTNGAGDIYAESGGAYTRTSEIDYDLADTDGFEVNLTAVNDFAGGTSSRINFRRRILGQIQEMASIRESTSGAEAASTSKLSVFTRKAGVAPSETVGIALGVAINGGSEIKKVLQASAALDFPSVAAQNFQTLTIAVPGAATNDIVCLGLPSNGYAGGLAFKAHVSAADVVTVTAQNFTAAAIDPGNLSCRVMVVGF